MSRKLRLFDIETDGFNPTKIWCLSGIEDGKPVSYTNYEDMRTFINGADILVGHNICRFDIPAIERLLEVEVKAKLVDTLALSWYLEPTEKLHGLEEWGEKFGVPKPIITDWENLSIEEYVNRCEQDVRINWKLWIRQWRHLNLLYDNNHEEVWRLVDYLTFKMDCAKQQEQDKWKLDVPAVEILLERLKSEASSKVEILANSMPKIPDIKVRNKPPKMYLKNKIETLTKAGEAWLGLLRRVGLPQDHTEPVEEIVGYDDPNPASHPQIKAWLYELGWEPMSFDYKRNKETNDLRKIPQIKNKQDDSGGLCLSVRELFEKEPALEALEGLSIINHRIGVLEGFLENVDEEGYVKAQVAGFTNTLRFKHRTVVNLPGVDKPYGADIRGCLTAVDGWELCGSDMSSLEDSTKQHYMYPHDPEYVKEMQQDGYDPHLALAMFAGELSARQVEDHKAKRANYKPIRQVYKSVNYACVYGARPPTVARTAKCSVDKAEKLVDAYWRRNWAVLRIAEDCVVKVVKGQKWLFNPVSKFWYSLRYEKDRFSTLNQGTGVYCFDTWIKHIRAKRKQLTGQMHDEVILCIKKGNREKAEALLREAIRETNEELKLNVSLNIDIQFGGSYAAIH